MIANVERILKVIELRDIEDDNMAEQLQNLTRERQFQKEVIEHTIVVPARELLELNPTDENKFECRALLETLCEKENEVKLLNQKFPPLIKDDNEYRNELVTQTEYSLKIKKLKLKLQSFTTKSDSENTENRNQNVDRNVDRAETGVKLPKFVLQKFDGDILKWKQFEESYEAAIHKNEKVSNVEKFAYLIGYLEKAPLQAVENSPLTSDNYIQAWELLKERYGNPYIM